jgi:flagellar biosynthetic protein FliP
VCMSAFLRIIIVLSMLRHAFGMQETPPNAALLGLSLFLTLFVMSPVIQEVNQTAVQPFMQGTLSMDDAYERAVLPMRKFMVRQTREEDLALMLELSGAPKPETLEQVSNVQLIPAFMLSELRVAFQIGFVIFLPFLLIDLIVSSVLMGLGMMMMPPVTVSLPIKILLFVLIDGWGLVLRSTIGSFH